MEDEKPAKLTLAITNWNYEKSVKEVRPKVIKWTELTCEVARELYLARENLRQFAATPELREGHEHRTWTDYCTEIGLNRRTANGWLSCFIPAELSADGQDHFALSQESAEDSKLGQVRRIAQFRETGVRPDDWRDEDDAELRRQEAERLADEEATHFVSILKYKQQFHPRRDYFADMLSRSKDAKTFRLPTRAQREIQQQAFDGVTEYLHTFKDMDDRAKAAVNLSYKLRQIVNDCMEALAMEQDEKDSAIDVAPEELD